MERINYFTIILSMLVFFVGLINSIFDMTGAVFVIEILLLGVLMLISLVSLLLIYNNIRVGYALSSFVSLVVLINLLFVYLENGHMTLLILSLAAAAVCFFASILNLHEETCESCCEDALDMQKEAVKVVSSKTSKTYHLPDCPQAKKLKKKVWYDSMEDAAAAGLKAHSCVAEK